jgi:ribosomal protein L17
MYGMERMINKAKNNKEAEKRDIIQQIKMTPEQRQKIAKELKRRFYGNNTPDVRESERA